MTKHAIIMGATSGLGKGVALGLLREGYTIGVARRRNEKRFDWTYIEALAQLAHMQKLDIKFTDIRPGFVATDFIAGGNFPLQMTTEYAVNHILKAVLAGKRKATIDWKYKIVCFFWRLLPSYLWERMRITN